MITTQSRYITEILLKVALNTITLVPKVRNLTKYTAISFCIEFMNAHLIMTLNLNYPPFIMQLKSRKCHFDLY